MLLSFLVFLPVAAGLFWIAIHTLMANRARTYAATVILLAAVCLHLFADACYTDAATPSSTLLISSLLAQLVTPAILPLAGIYLSRLRSEKSIDWRQLLWIVFPTFLFSAGLAIVFMAGPAKIMDYLETIYSRQINIDLREGDGDVYAYYLVTNLLFRVFILIELLGEVAKMLVLMYWDNLRLRHVRRFFAGERIRVLELRYFTLILTLIFLLAKAVLSREALARMPWITILLSFLQMLSVFAFSYIALFGARRAIFLREMKYAFRFNFDARTQAAIEEEMLADMVNSASPDVLRNAQQLIAQRMTTDSFRQVEEEADSPAASIHAAVSASWDDDSLLSRFEDYIFRQKGYLEPGITLLSVSEKLSSNKTYISRLVNGTYNMPFPDLINTLRIEFAQQYLAGHRNARQNEVAQACGFASASAFNNIFKKVTGMTPKIWLATHE